MHTLVQRQPPSDPDLSEAARKTVGAMALPFGFSNAATAYQHALRGKLTDQVTIQLPLAVNMSQNRPIYKSTSTMAARKRSHYHT